MNILQDLLKNLWSVLRCVHELSTYASTFLWAMLCPKAVLAARLLAVESQLAVCTHRIEQKKDPRPRFTCAFRLLWVVLSKALEAWEDLAHVRCFRHLLLATCL